MLDLKYLRHHLEQAVIRLKTRGHFLDKERFLALEAKRRTLQEKVQQLQEQANQFAKQFGITSTTSNSNPDLKQETLLTQSRSVKTALQMHQKNFQLVKTELDRMLLSLPNLPDAGVPVGASSEENQCVRSWGTVPTFNFAAKDHTALAVGKQAMDFESAATMTGSRFVVLKGSLARLQRALTQWMLDVHTQEHGYTEAAVPYLVHGDSLEATGQLPSFEKDLFKVESQHNWYLIPTGEVPLTNLGRQKIFEAQELPTKYVSYTPCFRSEAGSYGQDVKGMIRQHQFDKVELVQFVRPDQGLDALENLTNEAEVILQRLGIAYRVMNLCSGDLGFSSAKTYDLEVWLPGQGAFREISSCSYMGDFQARRLKARWRCHRVKTLEWVHTLNGSGLAVGRTLVALLENYQQQDGSIRIPQVLQSYMGGMKIIPPMT